ncbi:MAG TPA: glycosyl hydrolase family 65 protein [Verrucomicrobiae bacterium]|nr:glycosyl hydrolase family 65 protein [Verrucomicrobiae bacterium]
MGDTADSDVCATIRRFLAISILVPFLLISFTAAAQPSAILQPAAFSHHVERFNAMEDENVTNLISNAESSQWLQANIPFFECPDREVEEIYYFRWWSFRKHLKQTPKGFVFTEFLTPVSHAGEFNTISCAASFHVAESRWLADQRFVENYIHFWMRGNDGKPAPHFHRFSSWFAETVYERFLADGDRQFLIDLLPDLVGDYRAWEQERQLTNGMFWQFDVRDGMEESISGGRRVQNVRPTINSYMAANARAISRIAQLANEPRIATEFESKSERLRAQILETLWNPDSEFFEVRRPDGNLAEVREAIGFIPWMFNLVPPEARFSAAWRQLMDVQGFRAPAGITTAERRHPEFRSHGIWTCEWDGAVWPFATSQTLYALANFLRSEAAAATKLSTAIYFDQFVTYVRSQYANGKPFIGEYHDEVTGGWINGRNGRSRYYNHSTFADLLITGLAGIRPRADNIVEVHPLLPEGTWDWFCLDRVPYHGSVLTIVWDKDGSRYGRGPGLRILANGTEIARGSALQPLTGRLP